MVSSHEECGFAQDLDLRRRLPIFGLLYQETRG